ncbi:Lipoprotein NlpI precursor [Gimesia panareensis]|uniref:Lipoprotein NlpI n=1 Tax=Gimesia panareensis TaxID=2527978 RepID=A0A517QC99_9PLAN|nr:tetratricopeptide repeat protein [Gimesia panareensis]QDT29258.1 Lipoprotein NlpI precursor [Gimesia panareensis]
MRFWIPCYLIFSLAGLVSVAPADEKQQPAEKNQKAQALQQTLQKQVDELSAQIKQSPQQTSLYSRRGDAYFFLGQFKQAVADYDKMVELDPAIKTSHWRRGIACYYAKQYADAARQFEIYHSFDNVDRENGIWRFFSQYQAKGAEAARKGLLKYEKDDREPFPDLYRLFEGKTTPEAILKNIRSAEISDQEREKRLFYANLYIGLNASLHGQTEAARTYLKQAVANQWGPRAGFGPNYMWHTGRLELQLLSKPAK